MGSSSWSGRPSQTVRLEDTVATICQVSHIEVSIPCRLMARCASKRAPVSVSFAVPTSQKFPKTRFSSLRHWAPLIRHRSKAPVERLERSSQGDRDSGRLLMASCLATWRFLLCSFRPKEPDECLILGSRSLSKIKSSEANAMNQTRFQLLRDDAALFRLRTKAEEAFGSKRRQTKEVPTIRLLGLLKETHPCLYLTCLNWMLRLIL